ncbi:MAG: fibronectin type III domain-containing protein, partial [Muribaculaceae bacterium]|nr:fibronectin type III domain-containing protein [Muribaculaceae bacterium]
TYTVQVDGTEAATGTIEAGAEFAEQIDMTDGPHTVTAYLSNVVGDGAKASVKTYAGFDQPADVTGLGFVVEGNNVTVTWTAPEGANGGVVDTSKLTYKVTRNPDGVVVADNLTETTVTDVIPEGPITEYSYTVTVVYDGVEGQSFTTAGQLVGEPYTVPYSQNFDDVDSFGEIAFKSLADRNTTVLWQIADNDGNKCARLKYNYMSAVASHLFTAPIQMYKGVTYTLKFKVACSVGGETPQLRVNLSKGQTTTSSEFIYPWIASRIDYASTADNAGQYQELSYEFTVDEDGVYFIDFFDTTPYWAYGDTISIDDIEVTGVFPTPKAVTDLTAAPVETGSRDIKVSFPTPLQDIHGNDLSEISKVVIVRGNQT